MPQPQVELRSDTFTTPTAGMRTAMANAEVGDDVWGTDPTVDALQRKCAELFGFEAALYVVSGTMGNQLALRSLVQPGQELLCHQEAHIVTYERGAAAVHGQITTRTWGGEGAPTVDLLEKMLRPPGFGTVQTVAIAVENTHGGLSGSVLDLDRLRAARELTMDRGVAMHCDGARIWNAYVAGGLALSDCGRLFDTMSICLSKGLGAPIGSVVLGTADTIARAREMRARLGGGWRQAGILAAAGIYAIDNQLERLVDDHRRAKILAAAAGVDPDSVETNMVFVPTDDAPAYVARLADQGILCSATSPTMVRLVTHLDVSEDQIAYAAGILAAG